MYFFNFWNGIINKNIKNYCSDLIRHRYKHVTVKNELSICNILNFVSVHWTPTLFLWESLFISLIFGPLSSCSIAYCLPVDMHMHILEWWHHWIERISRGNSCIINMTKNQRASLQNVTIETVPCYMALVN